jgi:beta-N-acetylhexosaminidase
MVTGSGAGPAARRGPRLPFTFPGARIWLVALAGAVALAVLVALVATAGGAPRRSDSAGPPTVAGESSTTPTAEPSPAVPTTAPASPSTRPSTVPPATSPTQPADVCLESTLAGLSPAARVGQLLMVGVPATRPQSLAATVRDYRLGGVFLHGRSAQSAATVRSGLRQLQDSVAAAGGTPLQIAVDQEGGLVQTFRGADFPRIPSALAQGRLTQAELRAGTAAWARRLAAVGITLDLAPVADTVPPGFAASNPPIGVFDRQYGSDPDRVAKDTYTVVTAAQAAGVLTTLKHFPGLGRVRANTDTATSAVDSTTTPDDPYLAPFASGIQAGSAAVMVSSARYPRLDSQSIAAFSTEIVTGLLRGRLHFDGLVVSDDLGAAVAVAAVPPGERAVRFVRAGGDLVLTIRPADVPPMTAALLAAARASTSFQARVDDAVRHVLRSKYRAGLLRCPPRR